MILLYSAEDLSSPSAILSKKRFLIELDKAFVKIRWAKRDDDGEDGDLTVMNDEEKKRIEEIAELEALKSRMVLDQDDQI
jgi:hypothetical protein